MNSDYTQILLPGRQTDFFGDERLNCLETVSDTDGLQRHVVGHDGARIGRMPPSDIIVDDPGVSRAHCAIFSSNGMLIVNDLASTNGTYVDGVRLTVPTVLPVGGALQIGGQVFKHEWRTRVEIEQAELLDRELRLASSYVQALLPAPVREGPIRAEWIYYPSTKLGGDAFGYGALSERLRYFYMIDVAGHGAGAAMHGVTVMNQLRQQALPHTDMTDPAQVLAALNNLFQMEQHADLYFTMWYGVYDLESRRLDFASAGHHPAFMVNAARTDTERLRTRNGIIGAMPDRPYQSACVEVPPGTSIYVFSDGVFEIVTKEGQEWGLEDFVPLILADPVEGLTEPERLFREVRTRSRPGGLDDDFSLVVMTFE